MKLIINLPEAIYKDIRDNYEGSEVILIAVKYGEPQTHGEWIIVDDCEHFIAKCSVCGRIEDSRIVENYPFCRCGAKMKGGDGE